MRTCLIFLFLLVPTLSWAQMWGTGMSGGLSCPSPGYGPSNGASNGNDEISNLQNKIAQKSAKIEKLKVRQEHLAKYLADDEDKMGQVLSRAAIRAIQDHYKGNYGYDSYQRDCRKANSGKHAAQPVRLPDCPPVDGTQEDTNLIPPPVEFCYNDGTTTHNTWDSFVEDDGTVSGDICDYMIPKVNVSCTDDDRDACHEGLEDFYKEAGEKLKIDQEIADLDDQATRYTDRLDRIQDKIAEGTYCPSCEAKKRGYANGGMNTNMFNQLGQLMAMASRGNMTFPMGMGGGGMGYPSNPYVSVIPGYSGMGPGGVYGGMPGGMNGGFGCQGSNPFAMGNPMGDPGYSPIYGGGNPFANPYNNMGQMGGGIYNPGAGPWGYPNYAGGMNPYGGFSPYGNPYGGSYIPGYGIPFGNPAMNFNMQLEQLKQSIQGVQNTMYINGGIPAGGGLGGLGGGGLGGNTGLGGLGGGYNPAYGTGGAPYMLPYQGSGQAPLIAPYRP